jgi:hypothetical protein
LRLRDLLPVQFEVRFGSLQLISVTLLGLDEEVEYAEEVDEDPAVELAAVEVPFGFAAAPVDEVGLVSQLPLEDGNAPEYDDEDPEAGCRRGFASPRRCGDARRRR